MRKVWPMSVGGSRSSDDRKFGTQAGHHGRVAAMERCRGGWAVLLLPWSRAAAAHSSAKERQRGRAVGRGR